MDTCAAEFEAYTPYYYSSYGDENEMQSSDKKKIMILGGGPNRIGQGIEFDYCCVHASFALREAGFETVMVNSNPETVSTDYDVSDRLYFEPLTLEDVLEIYHQENCDGAIVQYGGQTPLNLATGLQEAGVNVIGTSPESIDLAEDREKFKRILNEIGLKQPSNDIAIKPEDAAEKAKKLGYPILLRPSFVLGGRGMFIVYDEDELNGVVKEASRLPPVSQFCSINFSRKRSSWMSIVSPMARSPWWVVCYNILNLPVFTVETRPWYFPRTISMSI